MQPWFALPSSGTLFLFAGKRATSLDSTAWPVRVVEVRRRSPNQSNSGGYTHQFGDHPTVAIASDVVRTETLLFANCCVRLLLH